MNTKTGITRAGTAKTVITPPVGYHIGQWALRQGRSTGVYRDLYARALVISDGARRLAIVSLEVAGLCRTRRRHRHQQDRYQNDGYRNIALHRECLFTSDRC